MAILSAYVMPHPPIVVPEIGKDRLSGLKTPASFKRAALSIAEKKPETIIIVSPHATMYSDYIHISPGSGAEGSLGRFGYKQKTLVKYDTELVEKIGSICDECGFGAGNLGERDSGLDHGTLVPLYFINKEYTDYRLVRISISGLSRREHYRFGMLLGEAVNMLSRNAVLIASGDLSHKLAEDGPYGYAPEGPELDLAICDALRSGDFGRLFDIDETLSEKGADCGLNSFMIMAGVFDKKSVVSEFLSYEGPFGVGYALSIHNAGNADETRDFYSQAKCKAYANAKEARDNEDAYVRLARESLESYVHGRKMKLPDNLPDELTMRRAGVFVSIKKDGRLRGCIGTTEPTRASIAREIAENAISAGARDPRFPPIVADELGELVINVDVLRPPEPAGVDSLDVKRYGVIVTSGHRRGLLLPDLDGVDSVERQLDIACQKAGINPRQPYSIERFEVDRHT